MNITTPPPFGSIVHTMDLVTDKALDVDDKTIEEMLHEDIDISGFRDGLWHSWHVDVAVIDGAEQV